MRFRSTVLTTSTVLVWLVQVPSAAAPLALTIDDYVKRALEEGVRGKENALALESAGYSHEVSFRQTDAPTFSIGQSFSRGETNSGGTTQNGDAGITSLSGSETTPWGTTLNARGDWGETASGPVSSASGKPGLSLSGTQPLYLFVKNSVRRTRQRADIAFVDAKLAFALTRLSLRSQARSLYYNVMLGEESIKVEERKSESSQKLLDVTQALVEAGKTAPVETMRARIRVQTDRRRLHNAKITRDQAVLSAKNFIYMPLDKDVQFITQLEFAPFTVPLQRLVDYATLHRPLLQQLRQAVDRATLDLEAAYEPTRPTLALSGTYNYADQSGVLSRGWTWTAAANWTFFDSFITRDQVRVARIAQYVARLNLTEGERATQADIRSAYLDLKRTEKQILEFQTSREQARHNVDVLRLRFQNGLERLVDVFDGETEMRNLDNEYLSLLVQFNRSKDQLSELVGTEVDALL